VATEAAVLLLRRRHSRAVPHTVQFDPYTYRYERTFVPGGMTNFDPAPLLERITDRSSLVPQVLDHLYGKPNAPRAEVNGVKLFWRSEVVSTADDPETVVFASPLGGDSSFWSRQVTELLRQGYRVITYDGRGTGVSSPWPVPCSMPLLADDLVGLLEQADTGPVHLVGLALGAAVTAEVASRRPDLVRDLVLVSAYARADERILADTGRWRELARTEGMEALFEFCLPQLFTAEYIDANRIELDKLKTFFRLTLQDPESFSQLSLAGVAYDAGPALSRITCPALVVHGADDGLVGVELAQDVAARLPDTRCVVLPRAAHFLPWEAADRFNATLVEFLAGVTTPLS
jgi:pimeloyl-ACP methyl ester carboxylesterase